HSLEVTRRLDELTETGWPVLVAVSNKDFIGETLGVGLKERSEGTIAALAISAWQGARVFRVHHPAQPRAALQALIALPPPFAPPLPPAPRCDIARAPGHATALRSQIRRVAN